MTRREAKNRIAYTLWGYLEMGCVGSFHGDRDRPEDYERITSALREFTDEMWRRAGPYADRAMQANRVVLDAMESQYRTETGGADPD